MIDLHCHILPGLDDGAQNMDEAIKMAEMAAKDGIKKIVATPHLFRGNFGYKDLTIIEKKRKQFVKALKKNNIQIDVFKGAEVHISHNLIDEIKKNRKSLVLNQSSYMFVEFPTEHVFSGVKNLFFELMNEGITPVITHPERNYVFVRNPGLFYELIDVGALSQANSGSFTGIYGKRTQETVRDFIELGLIHFIASDCHNTHSIKPNLSATVRIAAEILGEKKAHALVKENPQAVLDDQQLPYMPDPVDPRKKEKSFNIKIPKIFWGKR